MKAELTEPKAAHPLDAARAVLHDPVASVAALGGDAQPAGAVRKAPRRRSPTKRLRGPRLRLRQGLADDLEAKLMALDAISCRRKARRSDLAAATEAKLAERLAAARDAEAQKAKRLSSTTGAAMARGLRPRQTEFLDALHRDWRDALRGSVRRSSCASARSTKIYPTARTRSHRRADSPPSPRRA